MSSLHFCCRCYCSSVVTFELTIVFATKWKPQHCCCGKTKDFECGRQRGPLPIKLQKKKQKKNGPVLAETASCVKMLRPASKRNYSSKQEVLLIKTTGHLPWTNPCHNMKSNHVDQRPLEKDSATRTWLHGRLAVLEQTGQSVQRGKALPCSPSWQNVMSTSDVPMVEIPSK